MRQDRLITRSRFCDPTGLPRGPRLKRRANPYDSMRRKHLIGGSFTLSPNLKWPSITHTKKLRFYSTDILNAALAAMVRTQRLLPASAEQQ